MRLTDEQIELYSRQIILREVGGVGQQALGAATALAIGAGTAHETCVSYLVGAGIGTVDLVDVDPARRPALPLPPPQERNRDVVVRALDHATALDLERYDVALALALPEHGRARLAATSGRPRNGTIVLDALPGGVLRLTSLPRDHGCVACVVVQRSEDASTTAPADLATLAGAGAMAALACCRWLLGIGAAATASALRLPHGSVAWVDDEAPRRTSCPRGCPPLARPV